MVACCPICRNLCFLKGINYGVKHDTCEARCWCHDTVSIIRLGIVITKFCCSYCWFLNRNSSMCAMFDGFLVTWLTSVGAFLYICQRMMACVGWLTDSMHSIAAIGPGPTSLVLVWSSDDHLSRSDCIVYQTVASGSQGACVLLYFNVNSMSEWSMKLSE